MEIKKRTEGKVTSNYSIRDMHKFYEQNVEHPVDLVTYSKLTEGFNEAICNLIIYNAFEFKMPHRLGTVRIRKRKIKINLREDGTISKGMLRPDWKATKELWNKDEEAKQNKKLVYHLNRHSNGFNHRWFWDKTANNIPNHTAYSLNMSRANDRELAKAIKSENSFIDYYE